MRTKRKKKRRIYSICRWNVFSAHSLFGILIPHFICLIGQHLFSPASLHMKVKFSVTSNSFANIYNCIRRDKNYISAIVTVRCIVLNGSSIEGKFVHMHLKKMHLYSKDRYFRTTKIWNYGSSNWNDPKTRANPENIISCREKQRRRSRPLPFWLNSRKTFCVQCVPNNI